jgi:hypothetical protein
MINTIEDEGHKIVLQIVRCLFFMNKQNDVAFIAAEKFAVWWGPKEGIR